MSLILDALNRSRQDDQQMPGLDSRHYGDQFADEGNRLRWMPWLALTVALAVIAWLLWDRGSDPAVAVNDTGQAAVLVPAQPGSAGPVADTVTEPVPEPVPAEPAPPASAPAVAGEPSLPAPSAEVAPVPVEEPAEDESSIAALYRQQQSSGKPAGGLATTAEPAAAAPAVAAGDDSATPASAQSVREEEVVDIEQMIGRARDELKNTSLAEHEAPFIAELSQQSKNAIPTIMYQRHDYSGVAARSSVVLNGKKLAAGASSAGLKVEEILPGSVVLSYRGQEFRLRALNSWVNL